MHAEHRGNKVTEESLNQNFFLKSKMLPANEHHR